MNCTSLYALGYGKHFQTPYLLGKVKDALRLNLNRERNSFQRRAMERRVKSILEMSNGLDFSSVQSSPSVQFIWAGLD